MNGPGHFSRRDMLSNAMVGAAMATLVPGVKVAFAQQAPTTPQRDILIVMFLRGAADGLQLVSPAGDPDYIANRPTIRIPTTGGAPGIGVGTLDGTDFYLHPATAELKTLYDNKQLAIVHAAGMRMGERSHFECQEFFELGANSGEMQPSDGWLTRHLNALGDTRTTLGAVSMASNNPLSMIGYSGAVAISSTAGFNVSGGDANANVIRALNQGTTPYAQTSIQTLDAIRTVQTGLRNLTADNTNYGYPGGALSTALRSIASLIRLNVGLEVAHVDVGGWDHHNNIAGEMNTRASDLARSLGAFWRELGTTTSRVTLVTMTEFGRRFRENASQGTDHGSGSAMFVLGGNVNGGKIYGTWPGLAANKLFNGDLDVTTDYRRVVGEILAKRQGARRLDRVFATVPYQPLGIVNGTDTGTVGGTPTTT